MANVYAIANGNWSSGAIWNTGTVPTTADDVFTNNFTVQVNGTFTVLSIRNTAATPIVAGGTFNLTNGSNLTTTASTGIVVGSATTPLTFALTFPDSATFNGSVLTITNTAGYAAINHLGTGTLNVVGNYNIDNSQVRTIFRISGAGILNATGTATNSSSSSNVVLSNSAATINWTGPITGGTVANATLATIYSSAGGNVNVTGNLTAAIGPAVTVIGGTTTVTGNVTGSSTYSALFNLTTAGTINVTGTITAGSGANAIIGLGLVTLSGIAINTNKFRAIYAPRVTIELTTTSWLYQTFSGSPANITLYASGASLGNPALADVRFGTVYGPSSTLVGTMRVQTAPNVLQGTLVDNTTGTLIMTPDAFIQELGVSTRPIAQRLQNCATVDTVGNQVASYNV